MLQSMSPRAIVGCLFVTALIGIVVGMIAFGPFLIAEHQRVAVWETLFIWFGDAVALFWFAVYFIRHFVFGIPIAERRGPSVRVDILWRIALVSIIGSL